MSGFPKEVFELVGAFRTERVIMHVELNDGLDMNSVDEDFERLEHRIFPLHKHIAEVDGVQVVARVLLYGSSNELTSLEIIGVTEALNGVKLLHLRQITLHKLAQLTRAIEILSFVANLEH